MSHPVNFSERYSRQIRLPEVGEAGQQALANASVLLVGMGGLGSPVAMYLAAAGVGKLGLADFDVVEESNLQRQIAHTQSDIGRLKTESAEDTVGTLQPGIEVIRYDMTLEGR